MFEKYTEKARRVIFFARYEASQFGSPYIETEHLLLGILREDKALTNRFLRSHASVESIRRQIEGHTTIREAVSTSVDLPISNECKRVLAYAAEEADTLGHKHIGTEHVLLGLLREEKCFAAELLRDRGLRLLGLREELARAAHAAAERGPAGSNSPTDSFKDLTQAAIDGQLEPVVGRDLELDSIVEILCCGYKKNPLLIGQRGAGKTAIVEGLAQRIAYGKVPSCLVDKRVLALKPEVIAAWPNDLRRLEELTTTGSGGASPTEIILFIDELTDLVAAKSGAADGAGVLKRRLLFTGLQCIGTVHVRGDVESAEAMSQFGDFFRAVHIRPLDEASTLSVLTAGKNSLENFHGVTYTEEALEFAAYSSAAYLPGCGTPGKAFELLDAAGSMVKLRQAPPTGEIAEAEKLIKSIVNRIEKAIANHEFEKARYYSEEERKQRENLGALREKLPVDDSSSAVVGRDHLKEVISRWAAYPYCP
jgi:ATP-dependent Clp protease ATP-binding subunit ClpC